MRFPQPEAPGVPRPQETDPCACTQQSFDTHTESAYSLFLELQSVSVSCFLSTVGPKDKLFYFFERNVSVPLSREVNDP